MGTIIEDMTGFTIRSSFFDKNPDLNVFVDRNGKKVRLSLVYGKNGSGKSTIARGFREYASQAFDKDVNISLTSNGTQIVDKRMNRGDNFFVFDEEFIESKVKIKEEGLDAVVLFGKQVDADNELTQVEIDIQKITESIEQIVQKRQARKENHIYWKKEIEKELKQDHGWADVDREIQKHKVKTPVTSVTIQRIMNSKPDERKSLSEIKEEFNVLRTLYFNSEAEGTTIEQKVLNVEKNDTIIPKSVSIFHKTIQEPKMTEREKKLLDLFGISNIETAKKYLADSTNVICSQCFQKIDEQHRTEILKEINNILNQEVNDFKAELENLLLQEINVGLYACFKQLSNYGVTVQAIEKYNAYVRQHNELIYKKKNYLFDEMTYDVLESYDKIYENLHDSLNELEKERNIFNETVSKRKETKIHLQKLNDQIAYFAIKDKYNFYSRLKADYDEEEQQIQDFNRKLTEAQNKKIDLQLQKKDYSFGEKEINDCLHYIFYSDKKLSVHLSDDNLYHLQSNGNSVSPREISCGERNALALCYYFLDIAQNEEETKKYSTEKLLIIDDPVSSFDSENRIGIASFLRLKLEEVLRGCPTTKVLVLSHDMLTIFNMQKIATELSKMCGVKRETYELQDKQINPMSHKYNEYSELLSYVYKYAIDENISEQDDLMIGNVMRRVLETFSTFFFKTGISEITTTEKIISSISNPVLQNYFKGLMYRLLLHNESHAEEKVTSASEGGLYTIFSEAEKRRTAKDLLCLIYSINRLHLVSYLPMAEKEIRNWINNIEN